MILCFCHIPKFLNSQGHHLKVVKQNTQKKLNVVGRYAKQSNKKCATNKVICTVYEQKTAYDFIRRTELVILKPDRGKTNGDTKLD